MNMINVRCPHCGATLSIENGLDSFFCSYCGSRLILEGQDKTTIDAKAKIIIADKIIEQKRYERELEYKEKIRQEEREDKKAKDDRRIFLPLLLLLTGLIVLIDVLVIGIIPNSKAKEENARLEALYQEIVVDIQNGKYQEALLKTNSLRYSYNVGSGSSKGNIELWDARRTELIEMINLFQEDS